MTASGRNDANAVAVMSEVPPSCHDNAVLGSGTLLVSFYRESNAVEYLSNEDQIGFVAGKIMEAYNTASPQCEEAYKRKMVSASHAQNEIDSNTGYFDTYWNAEVLCDPECPYPDPFFGTADEVLIRKLEEASSISQLCFASYLDALMSNQTTEDVICADASQVTQDEEGNYFIDGVEVAAGYIVLSSSDLKGHTNQDSV